MPYDLAMRLIKGNWHPANHAALRRVLTAAPKNSLAVLDWDNTCICGDVGEAFFLDQVFNLQLKLNPTQLESILPERVAACSAIRLGRQALALPELKLRILRRYHYLRKHGTANRQALHAFAFAMLALYFGLEQTVEIGPSYAYFWVIRLLAGFRQPEIWQSAWTIIHRELRAPLVRRTLRDPETGLAVSWRSGLRVYWEMKNLLAAAHSKSWHTAVVTGTAAPIVAAMIQRTALPVATLIGMSPHSERGIWTTEPEPGQPGNWGAGKTANILAHFRQPPLLVAGDGAGDADMLEHFPETKVRLVIDHGQRGVMACFYKKAEQGVSGYLRQRVCRHSGAFRP